MNKKWMFFIIVGILNLAIFAGFVSIDNNNSQINMNSINSEFIQTNNEDLVSEEIANQYAQSESSIAINLSEYQENSKINIDSAGDYVLSGILTAGQIVINVADDEEVQLYLDNATITNKNGSAIFVENAKEVKIILIEGTNNVISDSSNYSNFDQDAEVDAAIFSHDDLTITGTGSLTVYANYADGVESRDDLKISGGTITVISVDTGIFGNNSVEIESAYLVLTSGGDTIHSDGDIIVESGTMILDTGDDGMHADATLTINGGDITILNSYEGIEATDVIINGGTFDIVATDDGINGAGGNDSTTTNTNAPGGRDRFSSSQGTITINGGTITIEAATSGAGDGLDANGTITITGGDVLIKVPSSYRDYSSIDYDTTFTLTGGNVQILESNGTYTQVTESNVSNNMHGMK